MKYKLLLMSYPIELKTVGTLQGKSQSIWRNEHE